MLSESINKKKKKIKKQKTREARCNWHDTIKQKKKKIPRYRK